MAEEAARGLMAKEETQPTRLGAGTAGPAASGALRLRSLPLAQPGLAQEADVWRAPPPDARGRFWHSARPFPQCLHGSTDLTPNLTLSLIVNEFINMYVMEHSGEC